VLRFIIIYVVVFGITRALGRRELSALEPFDLVPADRHWRLDPVGVTQSDLPVTGVIMVLSTIGILQVLTSCRGFRFRRIARP
jgi:uncharacterized membrane protein YcaP (DUF421 family)